MHQYTVEQAAALLGLHVKTVRAYIRDGRLRAVKIGKQYRIAREDLETFAGRPPSPRDTPRRVEVSSVVRIEGIGRTDYDRLGTLLTSALGARPAGVRVELAYEEDRAVLQVIVLADLATSAQVFKLIDALAGEWSSPPMREK
jgi:excisionase family DNA binding protein